MMYLTKKKRGIIMKKVIIKEVQELNEHELELLLNDDSLQYDIMNYVEEIQTLYISDMLNYIRPYLYDYNIVPYDYSFMKVNVSDEVDFIHAVDKLNNDYSLLDDDMIKTLKLAIKAADDYSNAEVNSSDYYDSLDYMSLYIKDMREYLTNEFVSILEYYDTFNKVCKETDYVTYYLDDIYDSECLIDDDSVTLI